MLHDDGISALVVDHRYAATATPSSPFTVCSEQFLITGGLDASVKLWRLNAPGGGAGSNQLISSSLPIIELFEHDHAITALAMHPGSQYLAAGAADGTLIVWEVTRKRSMRAGIDPSSALVLQHAMLFNCQIHQRYAPSLRV